MRPYISILLLSALALNASAEPNTELVYKLKGSVVKVHTVTKKGGHGVGSGVVVGENLVATNCHVLADAAGINIGAMGETYTPVAVKEDWPHDVCILKFQFLPLKPAPMAESDHLEYEQSVFSIGFPGGPPKPLTTYGKIKALYPHDDSFIIRTSASFVMGASGSPLFDDKGQLIGLDTFKSPGRNAYFYSMPVKWIKALLDAPEHEKVTATDTPLWDLPEDRRPYFMRVVLPLQNGEWKDLRQIAQAWLQKEPNNPEAIYYLGYALENLGEQPAAEQQYKRALMLNPKHSSSLIALGKIARQQGNASEMQRLAMVLQELDSEEAEALK